MTPLSVRFPWLTSEQRAAVAALEEVLIQVRSAGVVLLNHSGQLLPVQESEITGNNWPLWSAADHSIDDQGTLVAL